MLRGDVERLRYNKQLIKELFKIGRHEIEAYRYYLICRAHYGNRAGVFTLDELMDKLHEHYGASSLHHRPGHHRPEYHRRLKDLFDKSILFTRRPDGSYKTNAERHFKGLRYATRRDVHPDDLNGSQAFLDACIACLEDGARMKSYKTTAEQAGVSVRRVKYANQRLQAQGRLQRTHNYIIDPENMTGDRDALDDQRKNLFKIGISTPAPVAMQYKGAIRYTLPLYAANSYSFTNGPDSKTSGGSVGQWLKALSGRERKYYRTKAGLYEFTDVYTEQAYILRHAAL